ncbi:MAG: GTP-binding protein [Candidatus Helarchaeota archaeon]
MSIGTLVNKLLEQYVSMAPIKAAAVVDSDGLVIGSVMNPDVKTDDLSIGAITSLIQSVSERMKKELKMTSRFGTSTMDTEAGKLIIVNIGNSGALTIIAHLTANTDFILSMAYIIVEKLVQIIEDNILDIDIVLPDLIDSTQQKYSYKMCILGDGEVGKTTLITTFVKGIERFKQDYKATIGANIMSKDYKLLDNIVVRLNIWDLAGQFEYFYNSRQMYLSGSQAIVFVYDTTRPETFNSIKKWYDEVIKIIDKDKVEFLLIGNKIDLENQIKVSYDQGKELSKELNIPFIQTSAKNGNNVDRAFGSLAYNLVKKTY